MASDATLEEYKALRQEIQSRAHLIIQIFTVNLIILVPFISGIAFYVLRNLTDIKDQPNLLYPYICLSPILILLPCTYLITSLRKDFFRCGTYTQVFLEDESELKWETALDKFREAYSEESFDPMFGAYWALFSICTILFGYTLYSLSLSLWHLFLTLLAALILVKSHWTYRQIPINTRKEFYNQWKDIKKTMDKKHSIPSNIKQEGPHGQE